MRARVCAAALLLAAAVACCVLVPVAVHANVVSYDTLVSYQIHSQDDLRQWPQTLLKGGNASELWFKFDFNYQTPAFCQSASAATGRVNPATSDLGCFLLNHDPPSLLRASAYNTSDDILDFVASPANSEWFRNPRRQVKIALCAKFDPPVCNGSVIASEVALNFTRLLTNFYERAQSMISAAAADASSSPFQVEFILDGAFTPTTPRTCLKDLWRPWNATFILGEDTPPQAWSDNDMASGADRFQINNMVAVALLPAQALEYGKFGQSQLWLNDSYTKPYPFLLWEPSDQATLQDDVAVYLAGPRHNQYEGQGLRFAINIDPVQMAVYTGQLTGSGWNFPVEAVPSAGAVRDTNPKVAVWSNPSAVGSNLRGEPNVLFATWWQSSSKQFVYRVWQYTYALQTPAPLSSAAQPLPLPARFADATTRGALPTVKAFPPLDGFVSHQKIQSSALFVSDDRGNFAVLDVAKLQDVTGKAILMEGHVRVDPKAVSSLAAAIVTKTPGVPPGVLKQQQAQAQAGQQQMTLESLQSSAAAAAVPISSVGPDSSLILVQATSAGNCDLFIRLYTTDSHGNATQWAQDSACLVQNPDPSIPSPRDVSVSIIAVAPNSPSALVQCDWNFPGTDYVIALAYSQAGKVYAAYGCLILQPDVVLDMQLPSLLGVGTAPSVSLAIQPSGEQRPFILITASDSYCFNSEVTNKRDYPALCDSVPNNQTGVLTYSYGPFSAFQSMLDSGKQVGPCADSGLLHGMFDMGSSSSAVLFAGPASMDARGTPDSWTLQVVEAHKGFQASADAVRAPVPSRTLRNRPSLAVSVDEDEAAVSVAMETLAETELAFASTLPALHTRSRNVRTQTMGPQDPVPASVCGPATEWAGVVIDAWTPPAL